MHNNVPLSKTQLSFPRLSRREALKKIGVSAAGLGTLGLLSSTALADPTLGNLPAPPDSNPVFRRNDIAILNFALNLEYLEAEYYTYGTTGMGIEAAGIGVSGEGMLGPTIVKPNPLVPFANPDFRQYGLEIAADERAHVTFLRNVVISLGGTPVAKPTINLRESFNQAAMAAGLGPTFDPFANEINFLIGAFIFEDVGVTAYKGAAPLIGTKAVLEGAAGILAVEAYHAGIVRLLMYQLGAATRMAAQAISDLRDVLDGAGDRDQGVVLNGMANLVPADANALAFSRTARQVLDIVYFGGQNQGGFFPNGLNGAIA
jgi:hypothetical protein